MRVKQQPTHRDKHKSLVDYSPSTSVENQSQSGIEVGRNADVSRSRMNDSVWSQGTNGITNLFTSSCSRRSDDELLLRISGRQFVVKRPMSPSPVKKKQRPKKIYRPSKHVLREIRHYQKSVHLLIPRAPFVRLVKEVMSSQSNRSFRFHANAITALQEACETFLVTLFEAANIAAAHAKRCTVMVPDMQMVRRICSMFNVGV